MNSLKSYYLWLTVFIILNFINPIFSQDSKTIELKSADRLEGKIIDNEEVREFIGNVHFVQKTKDGSVVKVWCDRALRFMTQNRIELYNNVKVVQDNMTITTKEGIYYGEARMLEGKGGVQLQQAKKILTAIDGKYFVDEKRAHFIGNVILFDTSSIIKCNELNYYESETRAVATGNVHVFEYANAVNIYGDSLVHIENGKYTVMHKNPRMVQIDTIDNIIDTTVITSRIMESFQDTIEQYVAIDNVQMVKGDIAARCGKANFYLKNDSITLQDNPIIWSGKHQITGDTIYINLENKQLSKIYVKLHAMAISSVDSLYPNRFNQLTSRELIFYFKSNTLQQIDAQKNATSLYYLFDENNPNGVNKSSGNRIIIDFKNNNVDRIKVMTGVEGHYYPEKMILNRENEYNLDGFKLYLNRPVRRGTHIISE